MVGSTVRSRQFGLGFVDGRPRVPEPDDAAEFEQVWRLRRLNITSNGAIRSTPYTPYQAMRHAFAFCLVVGNARCAFESSATILIAQRPCGSTKSR